jgi:hypothetical protein
MIHLRGLAERAGCDEQPLGPGVTVPETVPVLVEFSIKDGPIGTATLTRDEHGIWADAILELDVKGLLGDLIRKTVRQGTFRELWPAFAIDIARTVVTKDDDHPAGVITSGEVMHLSLCRANRDPDLPPYEVVCDDTPA